MLTTATQPPTSTTIPASTVLAQGLSSLLSTANITPPSEVSMNNQNNNENVAPNSNSTYDIHYNNNHNHHAHHSHSHHHHHNSHHNQSNTLYMNGTITTSDKTVNEKVLFLLILI